MIVTQYNLAAGLPLRIAHLSDLHEASPDEVICLLQEEKPDLIVITGDLIERVDKEKRSRAKDLWYTKNGEPVRQPNGFPAVYATVIHAVTHMVRKICYLGHKNHHENAYRLLEEVSKIAPVYYSLGNHEYYLEPEDYAVLNRYGITLLDNSYVYTHGIWVGGLSSLYRKDWLENFRCESGYKILLMHQPEFYDRFRDNLDGIKLILSGHAHGGQWRIAGRGILAPGQGFLPKYHHGLYDNRLLVSSGMANTLPVPRFGNPTELVMIALKKA